VGKTEYERVTKKGYFVDHLENERKYHSIAQSEVTSEKPEDLEPTKAGKPKVKTYFFNNKYLKDKKSKGEPSK
jgi:hypothetical protein